MTPWEKFLSWYHSSEFEELRIADNVQRMASGQGQTGEGHLVCPTCRHASPFRSFADHGCCLWCGWKPRQPIKIWS